MNNKDKNKIADFLVDQLDRNDKGKVSIFSEQPPVDNEFVQKGCEKFSTNNLQTNPSSTPAEKSDVPFSNISRQVEEK